MPWWKICLAAHLLPNLIVRPFTPQVSIAVRTVNGATLLVHNIALQGLRECQYWCLLHLNHLNWRAFPSGKRTIIGPHKIKTSITWYEQENRLIYQLSAQHGSWVNQCNGIKWLYLLASNWVTLISHKLVWAWPALSSNSNPVAILWTTVQYLSWT